MINIKNIAVKRGGKVIVKNVSFTIETGKISVLIGRNGAGKSTLLDTISGRYADYSGKIQWDNLSLESMNLNDLANRRAVLSQQVNVAFPISVWNLVEMGTYAAMENLSRKKIGQLVEYALEEVKMLSFAHRDFPTLSGGEQKRVLLAKCIVQLHCSKLSNTPKYLFLDEPTASLDIEQQYKLIDILKYLVKRHNIGVFAILHDINLAAQFADEILLMKSGTIRHIGTPKTVINTENLKDTFGIKTIIQPHPVFDCPHVMTLPN